VDERERDGAGVVAMKLQRGFTLIEVLFTIAIVTIVALGASTLLASSNPFLTRGTSLAFDALLGNARAVAATSGNGATITVVNDASGFTATLYPGRPNTAGLGTAVQTLHENASLMSAFTNATSFAFFLNSAGTGTASTWTLTSGTLATEPPCPGALNLTITSGGHAVNATLACTDMRLR
jgi:prepilin-type N-terminal cleavage/methylation domain-containing protein